ncbi:MAG: cytochrome c biogenesis protein CcsA [Isosphaeraceae bacterium]|nr:cytochrome c biogenesis protein CcsA [Isosphaeraceae bacterium]
MDRLTVLCFGGTYALALASELARLVVRNPARWYLSVALTALGWLVHTAYLANQFGRSQGLLLVTTVFGSLLVLAWMLVLYDLYLVVHSPKRVAVGVFVLPVVLALVTVAGLRAPRVGWSGWGEGWINFWVAVHVAFLLLGAVGTCVAFIAGLMYLAQVYRLKHKRPPQVGFALPSLEQSERLNRLAITMAFPLLTFGLLIGVALILATRQGGEEILGWTDPKVIATGLTWLVFAVLLHARYSPQWRGRWVMVLTVVAFAFLLFTMVGVGLVLPTAHGRPAPALGRAP